MIDEEIEDAEFQSTRPVWGATAITLCGSGYYLVFQSTRPVWGATQPEKLAYLPFLNFNPRAPCGARQSALQNLAVALVISIHAPRVGRDRR